MDTTTKIHFLIITVSFIIVIRRKLKRILPSIIRFIVENDPDKLNDPFFKRVCLKYPEFHYLYVIKEGDTDSTFIGKENLVKHRVRTVNQFGRAIEFGGKRKFAHKRDNHRKT